MPTVNEVQTYAIVNDLHAQLTGSAVIGGVNATNFVQVFQKLLTYGTEKVFNALAVQVTGRLYSSRPYDAKFKVLFESWQQFGGIRDKVTYMDDNAVEDVAYTQALTNGQSVDMYVVHKPKILNTRVSGYNVYEDFYTRHEDQLKIAFRSWNDFAEFWAAFLTEHENKRKQWQEEQARLLVTNYIAALVDDENNHPERVVHLITEYNTQTGESLTYSDIFAPTHCEHFWRWVYGRYNVVLEKMGERTALYHSQAGQGNTGTILRHTPKSDMKSIITSEYMQFVKNNVLSVTFNPANLDMGNFEAITTWQNPLDPTKIIVTPTYLDSTTGEQKNGTQQTVNHIFGIAFDRYAMAISIKSEGVDVTPKNARGRYWNIWEHTAKAYSADFTENAVVFVLD